MKENTNEKIIFIDTDGRGYREDDLRLIWWLHVSEQLRERLTNEMIDAINKIMKTTL